MNKNSYFREINNKKSFPSLTENLKADILIIGAGLSGLSVAYELLSYSKNIVILEQNHIFQNTTSSTTAKITYQHGFIYHKLIKTHGLEKARLYMEYNKQGINRIEEIINNLNINCDFKKVNSYLCALNEQELINLNKEFIAYQKLKINAKFEEINPAISKYKALKVINQARFNITKYLDSLSTYLEKENVQIYENTKVVEVCNETKPIAKTLNNYSIIANKIIICSHYPFYKNFNFYFMKMIPYMAYAVLGKSPILFEDANYINTDDLNAIAIRHIEVDNEQKIIISGAIHKANKFMNSFDQINKLKAFGKNNLEINDFEYTWSGEDYASTDIIPYAGKIKRNIYTICAFNEWGMAASLSSAILIKDLLLKGTSIYKDLFNPRRVKATKELFTYNLKMLPTLIRTRIFPQCKSPRLVPNTGKVIRYNGTHIGIYMDEDKKVYFVRAICPHLHCGLRFNPIDKTYDCKCHGSRFKYNGKKIDGPAKYDLEILNSNIINEIDLNN